MAFAAAGDWASEVQGKMGARRMTAKAMKVASGQWRMASGGAGHGDARLKSSSSARRVTNIFFENVWQIKELAAGIL